jgi:large subunit ribosomal protein L9
MKVLLRKDVNGLGRRGDIVTVSSGHARNLLLPGGLAILATDGAVTQANSMRRARDLRKQQTAIQHLLFLQSWLSTPSR